MKVNIREIYGAEKYHSVEIETDHSTTDLGLHDQQQSDDLAYTLIHAAIELLDDDTLTDKLYSVTDILAE